MSIELIVCPLCSRIIHRHDATPATARSTISSRGNSTAMLLEMMAEADRAHLERVRAAERACVEHYARRHRTRLWLWQRLHWNALMNQRWLFWGSVPGETFKYAERG